MKKKILAAMMATTLAGLLMACGGGTADVPETPDGATGTNDTVQDKVWPEPKTVDLTGLEALPDSAAGSFSASSWGDTLDQVLDQEKGVRLVSYSAQMAGLAWRADFLFKADENGEQRLFCGGYTRDNTLNLYDPEAGMTQCIDEFNLVLEYLSETYGQPGQCYLSLGGADSVEFDTLSLELFMTNEATEADAAWYAETESGQSLLTTLELTDEGRLTATFYGS